eukprot:gb/GECH01005456.1/.p1 GENE.gb/GECH01005456.1/~~gb/GECH01005456.1/.p1  ORF type:complete len:1188 (+),score=215.53 gb/GECH01005456.1/:1-3564(+)
MRNIRTMINNAALNLYQYPALNEELEDFDSTNSSRVRSLFDDIEMVESNIKAPISSIHHKLSQFYVNDTTHRASQLFENYQSIMSVSVPLDSLETMAKGDIVDFNQYLLELNQRLEFVLAINNFDTDLSKKLALEEANHFLKTVIFHEYNLRICHVCEGFCSDQCDSINNHEKEQIGSLYDDIANKLKDLIDPCLFSMIERYLNHQELTFPIDYCPQNRPSFLDLNASHFHVSKTNSSFSDEFGTKIYSTIFDLPLLDNQNFTHHRNRPAFNFSHAFQMMYTEQSKAQNRHNGTIFKGVSITTEKEAQIGQLSNLNCRPGEHGAKCDACPIGYWCPGNGNKHLCSNAPPHAKYTESRQYSPNCPFRCTQDDLIRQGDDCVASPIGYYGVDGTELIESCQVTNKVSQMDAQFIAEGLHGDPLSCPFTLSHIVRTDGNLLTSFDDGFSIKASAIVDCNLLSLISTRTYATIVSGLEWSMGMILEGNRRDASAFFTVKETEEIFNTKPRKVFDICDWNTLTAVYIGSRESVEISINGIPVKTFSLTRNQSKTIFEDPTVFIGGNSHVLNSNDSYQPSFWPGSIEFVEIDNKPYEIWHMSMSQEGTEWKYLVSKNQCDPDKGMDWIESRQGCFCPSRFIQDSDGNCILCPLGTVDSLLPRNTIEQCVCPPGYSLSSHPDNPDNMYDEIECVLHDCEAPQPRLFLSPENERQIKGEYIAPMDTEVLLDLWLAENATRSLNCSETITLRVYQENNENINPEIIFEDNIQPSYNLSWPISVFQCSSVGSFTIRAFTPFQAPTEMGIRCRPNAPVPHIKPNPPPSYGPAYVTLANSLNDSRISYRVIRHDLPSSPTQNIKRHVPNFRLVAKGKIFQPLTIPPNSTLEAVTIPFYPDFVRSETLTIYFGQDPNDNTTGINENQMANVKDESHGFIEGATILCEENKGVCGALGTILSLICITSVTSFIYWVFKLRRVLKAVSTTQLAENLAKRRQRMDRDKAAKSSDIDMIKKEMRRSQNMSKTLKKPTRPLPETPMQWSKMEEEIETPPERNLSWKNEDGDKDEDDEPNFHLPSHKPLFSPFQITTIQNSVYCSKCHNEGLYIIFLNQDDSNNNSVKYLCEECAKNKTKEDELNNEILRLAICSQCKGYCLDTLLYEECHNVYLCLPCFSSWINSQPKSYYKVERLSFVSLNPTT